jgi:hypothetical protein
LIDKNVRQLVGQHFHVIRKFGMNTAVICEWAGVKDNINSRKDAIRHDFRYPKEVFDWYKSAEVHTHKRNIPARVFFLISVPFLIIGMIYFAIVKIHDATHSQADSKPLLPSPVPTASSAPVSVPIYHDAKGTRLTVEDWVADRKPRIADIAYSAPIYDEVTRPVTAPYPAACVAMKGECRCYSQQGTRLSVSADMCAMVVERGYFVDWDTQPRGQGQGRFADRQMDQGPRPMSVVRSDAVLIDHGGKIAFAADQPATFAKALSK